ncbi:hypothetical protein QLQ15_11850 [Lysobacter sp. LF1]|uniref:DUF4175 domain-containing protein n=1 Tax=Lysobacter stagni TaxID=3045172 RepID=A0ABT6XI01_9GAMM|nr:hypothetical protein [Lysobacter sp. LF1]MDI9239598.1 hypothetical protein [Lysobacter sp. LF1]
MSRGPIPRSPFVAPMWIALASVIALVSALIGDGPFDVLSWLLFGGVLGLVVRAWWKRDRSSRQR